MGGGHGAFSYFVLRGLNGDADTNLDAVVDADELLDYVRDKVLETTVRRQRPKELTLTLPGDAVLAQGAKAVFPGTFESYRILTAADIKRSRAAKRGLRRVPPVNAEQTETDPFDAAIRAGRLLPGEPGSAYDLLSSQFAPGTTAYSFARAKLQIALENEGQEVILQYLEGDQVTVDPESFQNAARHFEAAQRLAPDTPSVEGRRLFSQGRYEGFEENYPEAIRLLSSAARMDPDGAYSYNGLGIAYLELVSSLWQSPPSTTRSASPLIGSIPGTIWRLRLPNKASTTVPSPPTATP